MHNLKEYITLILQRFVDRRKFSHAHLNFLFHSFIRKQVQISLYIQTLLPKLTYVYLWFYTVCCVCGGIYSQILLLLIKYFHFRLANICKLPFVLTLLLCLRILCDWHITTDHRAIWFWQHHYIIYYISDVKLKNQGEAFSCSNDWEWHNKCKQLYLRSSNYMLRLSVTTGLN